MNYQGIGRRLHIVAASHFKNLLIWLILPILTQRNGKATEHRMGGFLEVVENLEGNVEEPLEGSGTGISRVDLILAMLGSANSIPRKPRRMGRGGPFINSL